MKTKLPFHRPGEDLPRGHRRRCSVFGLHRFDRRSTRHRPHSSAQRSLALPPVRAEVVLLSDAIRWGADVHVIEAASSGVEQGDPALTSAESGANSSKQTIGALVDANHYFRQCGPAHPYLGLLPL